MHKMRIKFLSLNMFLRPPLISCSGGDFKDLRTKEFISNYLYPSEFDILCLQEVVGSFSSRRDKIIQSAKKCGYEYSLYSECTWTDLFRGGIVDGGVLILSKLKLTDCRSFIFRSATHVDQFMMKGVLSAVVEDKFILVATHLQAIYDVESEVEIMTRDKQMLELSRIISKLHLKQPTLPLVLAGDLNTNGRKSKFDPYGEKSQDNNRMMHILRTYIPTNCEIHDPLTDKQPFTFYEHGVLSHRMIDVIRKRNAVTKDEFTEFFEGEDNLQRLDYILLFLFDKNSIGPRVCEAYVDYAERQFEDVEANNSLSNLSDHYGVVVTYEF